MKCMEASEVADLVQLLGPRSRERLEHLSACEQCLDTVAETAELAEALGTDVPVREGFVDSVAQRLREEHHVSPPSGARKPTWGVWAAGWLLAALTAFVAAVAASATLPMTPGPSALITSAVWATAAFALTVRHALGEQLGSSGD